MRRVSAWLGRGDGILMMCFCAIVAVALFVNSVAR